MCVVDGPMFEDEADWKVGHAACPRLVLPLPAAASPSEDLGLRSSAILVLFREGRETPDRLAGAEAGLR